MVECVSSVEMQATVRNTDNKYQTEILKASSMHIYDNFLLYSASGSDLTLCFLSSSPDTFSVILIFRQLRHQLAELVFLFYNFSLSSLSRSRRAHWAIWTITAFQPLSLSKSCSVPLDFCCQGSKYNKGRFSITIPFVACMTSLYWNWNVIYITDIYVLSYPVLPYSNVLACAHCHHTPQPPCGADSCRRHSAPQWLRLELPAPAAAPSESTAGCHRIAVTHTYT